MIKKSVSIALAAGLTLGAAFAASPALAVARGAGELNQDFGGPAFPGIAYNDADRDLTSINSWWSASVSDGTNTYVAGVDRAGQWSERQLIVAKYVNGVRDDSFGGDGVAEFAMVHNNAAFNYVNDIEFASNGELVIFGSLWDEETQILEQQAAFSLRISATGTNTIAGVWGNDAGDVLELGDELNLGVYFDPFLLDHEETWTESSFTRAVTYNYDGMQKWAVAGNTWTDGSGEYGWVASLTDEGQLMLIDGDGNADGYQFLDSNYNVEGLTGPQCYQYSWANDIVYDADNFRVAVLGHCDNAPALYAFQYSNLTPEFGYGQTDGVEGYLEFSNRFADLGWVGELELRDVGLANDYILGGDTSSESMPWLGVLDGDGALLDESLDNTIANYPGFEYYNFEDMIVDAAGLVYFTGYVSVGNDTDVWTMRWTANNDADVTWNAAGVTKHQIDGTCASEEAASISLSGDELMIFGTAVNPPTVSLGYNNDANWGTMTASVFTDSADQTAATGSAPVWDDAVVELEASTETEYSDSINATGTNVEYYTSGDEINEGLVMQVVDGVVEIAGTVTNADDDRWINVCASNEFGHEWTTIHIDSVSPLPYAPEATGPAELGDVVTGSPVEHVVPVDASPIASCQVTDGELPAGLVLDPETCVISGTPTVAGDYIFVVTATNSEGSYDFEYSGTVADEPIDVIDDGDVEALAKTGADSASLTALGSFAMLAVLAGAGVAMRRRESARS